MAGGQPSLIVSCWPGLSDRQQQVYKVGKEGGLERLWVSASDNGHWCWRHSKLREGDSQCVYFRKLNPLLFAGLRLPRKKSGHSTVKEWYEHKIRWWTIIQRCDWRAKKRATRFFLAKGQIHFHWKSLQIHFFMFLLVLDTSAGNKNVI